MKVEGWIFSTGVLFFGLAATTYWFLSEEPIGTVALAFAAGLSFLVGYYLLFTARRIDPRPEDIVTAEVEDGAGELGFYSPYSWWPLPVAFFAGVAFMGLAIGWWMFILGAIGAGMSVVGWVFEYYRGEPAA